MEKLQDGGIDLVLVDVSMPGMTGLELTVQARSSAVLRGVKIVVITANAQSTIAAAAHAAGADAVITKPFTVRELVQSIRDLPTSHEADCEGLETSARSIRCS